MHDDHKEDFNLLEVLKKRDLIYRIIRAFFHEEGFLEVQSPLLVDEIAPEENINYLCAINEKGQEQGKLITSPELYLKRIISRLNKSNCQNIKGIFQLSPVFRADEYSRVHLTEFTLLEWYSIGKNYKDLMDECERLLASCARAFNLVDQNNNPYIPYQGYKIDISSPFIRLKLKDAFLKYAGWQLNKNPDPLKFDIDLVSKIEPNLPKNKPVFLYDWPSSMASLSKLKNSDPCYAERVELYIAGIELANGFSELTDPGEQKNRFLEEIKKMKQKGRKPPALPKKFLNELKNMPQCAGMALGVDRLLMLLMDQNNINRVSLTP